MLSAANLLGNNNDTSWVLMGPMKVLTFNGTLDAERTIDARELFQQVVLESRRIPSIYEVTGRGGKFQPIIKYTPEFGLNVIHPRGTPNAVEIKLKDPQGLIVIYKTGKIRLQGVSLDETFGVLHKFVPSVKKADIKMNNSSAIFGINLRFKNLGSLPGVSYEQEINPFAYLRVKNPKCTVLFTRQGVVHILGASDLEACYQFVRQYLEAIDEKLYFIKTEIAPIKNFRQTGAARGRTGTTCPKDRCPNPYSYEGQCPKAGYYVRPNPQMFPCCYQSKRLKPDEVRMAYRSAGVNIPNSLKSLLGNNRSNSGSNTNNANLATSYNARGGLKIGTRQCMRYTLQQLKVLAERMKIDTTKLKTKGALCKAIEDKFPARENAPFRANFSMNGANYALVNRNGKLFINRRVPVRNHETGTKRGAAGPRSGIRACETILKEDLLKYARALGLNLNSKLRKDQICEALRTRQT